MNANHRLDTTSQAKATSVSALEVALLANRMAAELAALAQSPSEKAIIGRIGASTLCRAFCLEARR